MNKWTYLAISAVSDFVITAGSALMAIDVSAGKPTLWQIGVCVGGGFVQVARGIQKSLTMPPG